MIPDMWGLFETIDNLAEHAEMIRMIMINETRKLKYEHILNASTL